MWLLHKTQIKHTCDDYRRGLNKPPAFIPAIGASPASVIIKGDPINLKFRVAAPETRAGARFKPGLPNFTDLTSAHLTKHFNLKHMELTSDFIEIQTDAKIACRFFPIRLPVQVSCRPTNRPDEPSPAQRVSPIRTGCRHPRRYAARHGSEPHNPWPHCR